MRPKKSSSKSSRFSKNYTPRRNGGKKKKWSSEASIFVFVSLFYIFMTPIIYTIYMKSLENSDIGAVGAVSVLQSRATFLQERIKSNSNANSNTGGLQEPNIVFFRGLSTDEAKWWRGQAQVSGADHPHMGARLQIHKENKNGMILNPSPKRLKVPDSNDIAKFGVDPTVLCNGWHGIEGKQAYQALRKIKRGIKHYKNRVPTEHRKSKILCMVYTTDRPESRANLKAQVETWASKCDGFLAASNITDHSLGSIDLVYEGAEEQGNMWQKIRSMWAYAYDHYLDEYDFFQIAGDDVYIAIENLRAFLDGPDVIKLENGYLDEISRDPEYIEEARKWQNGGEYSKKHGISSRPLLLGHPCFLKGIYPCGGPGYTLNRAALEVLGRLQLDWFHTDVVDSQNDLFMGEIFANLGIQLSHVFDHSSGWRYMNSARTANQQNSKKSSELEKKYNLTAPDWLDGCSEEAATFHLKNELKYLEKYNSTIPELMYRYHAILYELC